MFAVLDALKIAHVGVRRREQVAHGAARTRQDGGGRGALRRPLARAPDEESVPQGSRGAAVRRRRRSRTAHRTQGCGWSSLRSIHRSI